MKDHCRFFSVEQMAHVLKVSKSGYYNFLKRPPSSRSSRQEEVLEKIKDIFKESFETYGSPRVHAELISQGYKISRPCVARLMKTHGIQAKMHKRFKKTTQQSDKPYKKGKDLVERQFSASKPNELWVADISYIPLKNQWCYLAIVLDLFSRQVVGMALHDTMKTDLILEALKAAIQKRKPPKGLIHYSDLGGQYTSHRFYKMAEDHGIILSHGKTGCAYDNAAMESFFHTLKTEWVHFKNYETLEEAKLDIFTYIYTFYNLKRRHSTLNYQNPQQWEKIYQQKNSVLNVQ